MSGFIKWMESCPKILKILFCLPGLGLFWGIYRLARSIRTGKALHIVLGIVMLILCPTIFWIVDLVCVLMNGKVLWFD